MLDAFLSRDAVRINAFSLHLHFHFSCLANLIQSRSYLLIITGRIFCVTITLKRLEIASWKFLIPPLNTQLTLAIILQPLWKSISHRENIFGNLCPEIYWSWLEFANVSRHW